MNYPTLKGLESLPKECVIAFSAYCGRFAYCEMQEEFSNIDKSLVESILEGLELVENFGQDFTMSSQDMLTITEEVNCCGDKLVPPLNTVAYSVACAVYVVKYFLDQNPSEAIVQAMKTFKNAESITNSKDIFLQSCCQLLDSSESLKHDEKVKGQIEKPKIFISYSSKHRGFIDFLCEQFVLMGQNFWLDRLEIDQENLSLSNRKEINDLLKKGIDSSFAYLILIDELSVNSDWVEYEFNTSEKVLLKNPEFKIIPLIHIPLSLETKHKKEQLINRLEKYLPIDFNEGFKTALAVLYKRLNPSFKELPRWGLMSSLQHNSRHLTKGEKFEDYIKTLGINPKLIELLIVTRKLFSKFSSKPIFNDIIDIVDNVDQSGYIDYFISGDISQKMGELGSDFALASSNIPRLFFSHNYIPSMNFPVRFSIISFWKSKDKPEINKLTTICFSFHGDGTAFIWLACNGRLSTFTLGSINSDSILLSKYRMLGFHPTLFQWPSIDPDPNVLFYRQALSNKLGFGGVQIGQIFNKPKNDISACTLWLMIESMRGNPLIINTTKPSRIIKEIWENLLSIGWYNPEATQDDLIFGHINNGGAFLWDVSPISNISSILSLQMRHIFKCAGAKIFEFPINTSDGRSWFQYLSLSPFQLNSFPNISTYEIDN